MANEPQDVLVTSRSFEEYVAFFDLDPVALAPRILDCSAGASAFTAEAHRRGVDALALDPVYGDRDLLLARVRRSTSAGTQLIGDHRSQYVYDWYGTPERRADMRADALQKFVADYEAAPHRYVAAALPELPSETGSFDLALCSHLLFSWATEFDESWHLAALIELCRVATEVRVFPLVLQGSGEPVEFIPRLLSRLENEFGISSEIVDVDYEFQRGAHHMLRCRSVRPR